MERVFITDIQDRVCERFGLEPRDMHRRDRRRIFARPRQVGMYLSTKLTGCSLPQIGRRFGGRHHTTVIHAARQIEALRLTNPEIEQAVVELTAELSTPREGFAQQQEAR